MTLRDLLNDHKWHTGDLGGLRLVIRNRGAPGDESFVAGSRIAAIRSGGVEVDDPSLAVVDDAGVADERTWIPYSRVLRVESPQGVIWARREP